MTAGARRFCSENLKTFRVWVRPGEYGCVVSVDGIENARWLLDKLGRSFVFCSAMPIIGGHNTSLCTFQVSHGPYSTARQLDKLLAALPEVTLLHVAVAE